MTRASCIQMNTSIRGFVSASGVGGVGERAGSREADTACLLEAQGLGELLCALTCLESCHWKLGQWGGLSGRESCCFCYF